MANKPFKKLLKKFLKSGFANWLATQLIYLYMFLINKTVKWQIEGLDIPEKLIKEKKGFIGICWHGRLSFMSAIQHKKYPIAALISPHGDGRLIARLVQKFDAEVINGSSNENSHSSALAIMRTLENKGVFIVPDGPRGPAQRMKISPIYFASKTKTPILLVAFSAKNAKIIHKSWDSTLIPKPFSKAILKISEPIFVPQNISDIELEKYRLNIENEMNKMQNEVDTAMGIPIIHPKNTMKEKKKR